MFVPSAASYIMVSQTNIQLRELENKRQLESNQRTNGPVNAHLRSAVYTNVIENSPSIGAGEALGPLFFQNNQYTVHTSFSLQMTF